MARRHLSGQEIAALVHSWHVAEKAGEEIEPLQHYLGFTDREYRRWTETHEPPYRKLRRVATPDEDKCEHCGSDPCTGSTEDCSG